MINSKMIVKTFPEFNYFLSKGKVTFGAKVRYKRGEYWYEVEVKDFYLYRNGEGLMRATQLFIQRCLLAQKYQKPFTKSDLQISEDERIRNELELRPDLRIFIKNETKT